MFDTEPQKYENPYIMLKEYEGQLLGYTDICKIINEEPRIANSKKAHIKKISNWVDLKKEGRKYEIAFVYDEPQSLSIIYNNDRYKKYIEFFLLLKFSKLTESDVVVSLSDQDILEGTYMVNDKYYRALTHKWQEANKFINFIENDKLPLNEKQDVAYSYLDLFFCASHRALKRLVRNTLDTMKKSFLIDYRKGWRLYKFWIDKNGIEHREYNDHCTDEEINRILEAYNKAAKEWNNTIPPRKIINGTETNEPAIHLDDYTDIWKIKNEEQLKAWRKLKRKYIQEEFKEEGYTWAGTIYVINHVSPQYFKTTLSDFVRFNLDFKDCNDAVQNKLIAQKDLQELEEVVRRQCIKNYIDIKE